MSKLGHRFQQKFPLANAKAVKSLILALMKPNIFYKCVYSFGGSIYMIGMFFLWHLGAPGRACARCTEGEGKAHH